MGNRKSLPMVRGGPLNLLRFARDPLGFVESLKTTYGDEAVIRIVRHHVYFFSCADAVYQVLVKQAKQFDKWHIQKEQLRLMGEFALPNLDGEVWRRHRKMMQPAFHTQRIQAYADDIIQQTETLLSGWGDNQIEDIGEAMKLLTLRIVGRAILGTGVADDELVAVGQAMATVQDTIIQRGSLPFHIPDWFPTSNNRRFVKSFKLIIETVNRIIQQRQGEADGGDLLSAMIHLRESDDKPLSAQELLDETIALFIGGHETTASTLTWAWYELASNPDVAEAFYAEVDSLAGKTPTVEDLSKLPYVDAVMKETLRRYPPLYFLARTPNQPTTVLDHAIPGKHSSVLLNVYMIHHDERYYDEPNRFMPSRWLADETGETLEKRLPRGAYVPFGDGARICIGNHFAMLEMCLILIAIAQRFRLELLSDEAVTIQAGGTLIPRGGLHMRVRER